LQKSLGKRERLVRQRLRLLEGGPAAHKERGGFVNKVVPNVELRTFMDEPWMLKEGAEAAEVPMTVARATRMLLVNMRQLKGGKNTFHDDEMALLIAEALRREAKNGQPLVFEETPYRWLIELVKAEGPKVYSPHTPMLVRALEAVVKEADAPIPILDLKKPDA